MLIIVLGVSLFFCLQNLFASRLIFLLLKTFKNLEYKRANMGLAEVFRAKVEGRSSKNFLGAFPPDPLSRCPLFICHIYVLISKISGVAQGLVYLELIGYGTSIGPHPEHSHLQHIASPKSTWCAKVLGGKYLWCAQAILCRLVVGRGGTGRTAEYGSFQRDLGCARTKYRVCKCAVWSSVHLKCAHIRFCNSICIKFQQKRW